MNGTPVATSPALWSQLLDRGDLQTTGRDLDLVRELTERLSLPSGVAMVQALEAVPVERLIAEFFRLAEPFAAMWQDLLVLFERAAATTGSDQLDIRYDFGTPDPKLAFSLESFRRYVERALELMSPFDLRRAVDPSMLWNIAHAFETSSQWRASQVAWPAVLAAAESLRRDPFPAELPPRPRSLDPRLDDLLEQTWLLVALVLRDVRTLFVRHEGYRGPDQVLAEVPSGMPFDVLRISESDYWLAALLEAMSRAIDADDVATIPILSGGTDLTMFADRLEAALEPLRNADPSLRSPQRRLEELLSLPMWRHRYDLYSNWVTTRIIAALEDAGPILHSASGRIEFAFSGTHLATFDRLCPRVHVWCEYRTPLADPVGRRKGNIQPDITLRTDPITAGLTPLVVECKQYAAPDNESFAHALTDYARGHPDAAVVLVNYGPGREATVLDKVPAELRIRTAFVPLLRPGSGAALSRFAELVRRGVALPVREQPRSEKETTPGGPAPALDTIVLRWGYAPNDLDLRLIIGERWHVSWQSLGSLSIEPYARLIEDVQHPGSAEIVEIAKWLPQTYRVEVINFSGRPPLADARASLELTIDGHIHVFTCPPDIAGGPWKVCTIDGRTRTIETG